MVPAPAAYRRPAAYRQQEPHRGLQRNASVVEAKSSLVVNGGYEPGGTWSTLSERDPAAMGSERGPSWWGMLRGPRGRQLPRTIYISTHIYSLFFAYFIFIDTFVHSFYYLSHAPLNYRGVIDTVFCGVIDTVFCIRYTISIIR